MKKRSRLLCLTLSMILTAALLAGCSFRLDDWYFFNGKWKEDLQTALEEKEREPEEPEEPSFQEQEGSEDYSGLSFDEFLDALFAEAANTDTLTLHFFLSDPEAAGIVPGPVTLGRVEEVDEEENSYFIESVRRSLESYPREELTREQRITADILEVYLDGLEKDAEMQYYYEPFNQGTGLHVSLPYTLAEYAFYDQEDVEDYLSLLEDLDAYYQSALAWEEAQGKGRSVHAR